MLGLYHELKYIFPYYQHAQMSSYQTPKLVTFLSMPRCQLIKILNTNRIQYITMYTYLSGSAFLANLTSPNNQAFQVKS